MLESFVLFAIVAVVVLLIVGILDKRPKRRAETTVEPIRGGGGYWSFSRFTTPTIVKVLYPFGVLGLTIIGIAYGSRVGFGDFQELSPAEQSEQWGTAFVTAFFSAAFFVIGANLSWRIICEAAMVLFRIHERLTALPNDISHEQRSTPKSVSP